MGIFTCANCKCEYYDRRFYWEEDVADVASQQEVARMKAAEVSERENDQESRQKFEKVGSDPNSIIDQHRTTCDAVRASGTMANLAGMAAPVAHVALGAVSAIGGVVGASAGIAQLHQGLNTPSGKKDPHLVAKGSVTTGVGATCIVIGACATVCPPLFFVAAGVGAAGLGTAIGLDANMDGLCLECRGSRDEGKCDKRESCEKMSDEQKAAASELVEPVNKEADAAKKNSKMYEEEGVRCKEEGLKSSSWTTWIMGIETQAGEKAKVEHESKTEQLPRQSGRVWQAEHKVGTQLPPQQKWQTEMWASRPVRKRKDLRRWSQVNYDVTQAEGHDLPGNFMRPGVATAPPTWACNQGPISSCNPNPSTTKDLVTWTPSDDSDPPTCASSEGSESEDLTEEHQGGWNASPWVPCLTESHRGDEAFQDKSFEEDFRTALQLHSGTSTIAASQLQQKAVYLTGNVQEGEDLGETNTATITVAQQQYKAAFAKGPAHARSSYMAFQERRRSIRKSTRGSVQLYNPNDQEEQAKGPVESGNTGVTPEMAEVNQQGSVKLTNSEFLFSCHEKLRKSCKESDILEADDKIRAA